MKKRKRKPRKKDDYWERYWTDHRSHVASIVQSIHTAMMHVAHHQNIATPMQNIADAINKFSDMTKALEENTAALRRLARELQDKTVRIEYDRS